MRKPIKQRKPGGVTGTRGSNPRLKAALRRAHRVSSKICVGDIEERNYRYDKYGNKSKRLILSFDPYEITEGTCITETSGSKHFAICKKPDGNIAVYPIVKKK